MNKSLFEVLSKTYGNKQLWIEVESVFKSEGFSMDMNDFYDPFKNLVIGILSQNTNDKNSTRAYIGLIKSKCHQIRRIIQYQSKTDKKSCKNSIENQFFRDSKVT